MKVAGEPTAVNVVDPQTVASVLEWWSQAKRELPWRETRNPWLILVSEVMSQQTQVDRVIPKWTSFIERFPTPLAAAEASAGDLISMWDGLGYNRRALLLHRCAQEVVELHGGELPDDLEQLLALPGIGPYTARAVLAFANERDVAVLDTNVGRVLARWTGHCLGGGEAQSCADDLVPSGRGWEWNQAILDFGAQICKKRKPGCENCPVRTGCAWAGNGPDPALGSAGVSGSQSVFAGSDREGRGRLVKALRRGPVDMRNVGDLMGFGNDVDRSSRVLGTLIRDGLVVSEDGYLRLP